MLYIWHQSLFLFSIQVMQNNSIHAFSSKLEQFRNKNNISVMILFVHSFIHSSNQNSYSFMVLTPFTRFCVPYRGNDICRTLYRIDKVVSNSNVFYINNKTICKDFLGRFNLNSNYTESKFQLKTLQQPLLSNSLVNFEDN